MFNHPIEALGLLFDLLCETSREEQCLGIPPRHWYSVLSSHQRHAHISLQSLC